MRAIRVAYNVCIYTRNIGFVYVCICGGWGIAGAMPESKETTVRRNIVLPADLDRRLRKTLNQREDGMKKGDISDAVVEALVAWLDKAPEGQRMDGFRQPPQKP
jgi:hypothetical protein